MDEEFGRGLPGSSASQDCNQGVGWDFASKLTWSLAGFRFMWVGGLRASVPC